MKRFGQCLILSVIVLIVGILPAQAAGTSACQEANGWRGRLGVGNSSPNVAERVLSTSFIPGDIITVGFSGMEVGAVIEIPSGNPVVTYPFSGFNFFGATFTYVIPDQGVDSIKITLNGYYMSFMVSCKPIIVDPPDEPEYGFSPVVTAPDNRLNWQNGDNLAVIYPSVGENSKPALDVYVVTPESEGEFLCRVTQDELSDDAPASNTLIKSCGALVNIYRLTTGEIQFNIGADAEGKIFEVILSGL